MQCRKSSIYRRSNDDLHWSTSRGCGRRCYCPAMSAHNIGFTLSGNCSGKREKKRGIASSFDEKLNESVCVEKTRNLFAPERKKSDIIKLYISDKFLSLIHCLRIRFSIGEGGEYLTHSIQLKSRPVNTCFPPILSARNARDG